MQIDTLRILDRFVGIPLCAVCTLVRAVFRPFKGPDPLPRKILIIKL